MTWTVNLAAGTQVVLFIEDAACDEAWSGTVCFSQGQDFFSLTIFMADNRSPSATAVTPPA